jgi:hypothetical protein
MVGAKLWAALAISFALFVPYLLLLYGSSPLQSLAFPLGGIATIAILLVTSWLRERLRRR